MVSAMLIKVKFGNNCKRINVDVDENNEINLNMVSLTDKIRSMFSITADESFNLTYVAEDGNVKNLVGDDDLYEGMRQQVKFLRIDVHGDGLFPTKFSKLINTIYKPRAVVNWNNYAVVVMAKYDDWRFFNVDLDENNQINLNMVGLTSKIRSVFKFSADKKFNLTYVDEDGDMINLVDDDDLNDLKRQKLKLWRIDVRENGLIPIEFYLRINRIYRSCGRIDWNEDMSMMFALVATLIFFLFIMPMMIKS